jgi:hypothetical protein
MRETTEESAPPIENSPWPTLTTGRITVLTIHTLQNSTRVDRLHWCRENCLVLWLILVMQCFLQSPISSTSTLATHKPGTLVVTPLIGLGNAHVHPNRNASVSVT